MGVLRRVDINWSVVVGTMIDLPMVTGIRGLGRTERSGYPRAVQGIEELDSDIGELGIGNHQGAPAVDHRVPGIERTNRANLSSDHFDPNNTVRPIGREDFHRAGPPGFMNNPFLCSGIPSVDQTVA